MRDMRERACLEVGTRVSGGRIWLRESIAEVLTGGIPFIFSSLFQVFLEFTAFECIMRVWQMN